MATSPRAKLPTVAVGRKRWGKTAAQEGFIADVVSPRELREVMRARGGADDLGDRGVAWVAGRQLGLITTWQLRAVGVRDSAIWFGFAAAGFIVYIAASFLSGTRSRCLERESLLRYSPVATAHS